MRAMLTLLTLYNYTFFILGCKSLCKLQKFKQMQAILNKNTILDHLA